MDWDDLIRGLDDQKLEWANRAYQSFMAELEPTIRKAATSAVRPKVDAALYGETQVGKSTLLLTLLGVRQDRLGEVADILRAGRPRGMSSTPTATRYRAARDDRWTINLGDGTEQVTEQELMSRIAGVRAAVTARRWSLGTVVEIAIPACYFEQAGGSGARILDLPGVQATNAVENDHARRLIDKWVALADVVLLVTRVDRLAPLRPNRLAIEALRHWPRQLSKYRVVLTHTYSNEQTAHWLDDTPAPDRTLRALRIALRGAFGATSHFKHLDRTSLHWLYPVEFGDSWRAVVDPAGRGAQQLRDEAMAELRRDLALAVRPETRLRRTFETHDIALEIADNLRQSWDHWVKRAHDRVARLEKAMRQQAMVVEDHTEELARIDAALAGLDKLRSQPLDIGPVAPNLTTDDGRPDVGGLQGQLRVEAATVWRAFQEAERREVRRLVQAAGYAMPPQAGAERFQTTTDAILQAAFDGLELPPRPGLILSLFLFIADYSWSDRLRQRQAETEHAYEAAARRIEAELCQAAGHRIGVIAAMLDDARLAALSLTDRTRMSIMATDTELAAAKERVHTAEARRDTELTVMAQHVAVAGQFPAHLKREYGCRRADLLRDVAEARNPLEKLASSAALVQAANIYDRIRNGD